MRVIYSLSHFTDWIGFALEMNRRLSWEPVFWLTTQATDGLVQREFPSAIRQSYQDIIKGVNPSGIDLFGPAGVDDAVVKEFAWEMDQALKMMDRLDSGDAFSYNERKNYFTRILSHSLNLISGLKPELIVFTETPHHATQYILYAACKRRGVHTLMFKPVAVLATRQMIYQSITEDPMVTMGPVTLDSASDADLAAYRAYVAKLRGEQSQAAPQFVKEHKRTSSHSAAMFGTVRKLLTGKIGDLFDRRVSPNILKLKGNTIEESSPSRLQLYMLKLKGSRYKRNLRASYRALVSPVPTGKKFVFVPLHYQPERTSSPDGGTFVMQYLMVALLRKVLPGDTAIVVKEHSLQFHPKFDGHLGRLAEDYTHLARLANVYLVDADIPSFELIDKSFAVATIAGTVGLESVARGRPVLVFGPGCWYRSLRGAFYTPTEEALREAIAAIDQGFVFQDEDLARFLFRVHQSTFVALRNPVSPRPIPEADNVKALADAVVTYTNHVLKPNGD